VARPFTPPAGDHHHGLDSRVATVETELAGLSEDLSNLSRKFDAHQAEIRTQFSTLTVQLAGVGRSDTRTILTGGLALVGVFISLWVFLVSPLKEGLLDLKGQLHEHEHSDGHSKNRQDIARVKERQSSIFMLLRELDDKLQKEAHAIDDRLKTTIDGLRTEMKESDETIYWRARAEQAEAHLQSSQKEK